MTDITLRATKGTPLTHAEVDTNFTNLKTTADAAETNAAQAINQKANATSVGVAAGAADMGVYSGSTIPDNETAKQNIQSLEVAVETKANASALGVTASAASMGTFTGTTIADNQTAKVGMQSLETAVELRATIADLASTTGAGLVGTTDGRTVQAIITALTNGPNTDNFIENVDSAIIHRMNDRVFIGGAVNNDGDFPNVTKDWLSTFETVTGGRANGTMVSAQVGILNNEYFGAGVGLLTGVRTVNFISAATGASGHTSIAVNNNATLATNAWAFYGEGHRANDTVGSVIVMELDVSNFGSYKPITPYLEDAKMTVALQLGAGSEYPSGSQFDMSAAINIRDNTMKFGAGIVFGENAIRGTDGVTGTGNAMLLATRHRITWMMSDGTESGSIQSTITSAANKTRLAFTDTGFTVLGPNDNIVGIFRPVANAANYLDFTAGAAGISPIVAATGSDADLDLVVQPKGTGLLKFATATSMIANGAVATVLGSVGPTGASTTVRKWLSVRDSAGTQLYIPCF